VFFFDAVASSVLHSNFGMNFGMDKYLPNYYAKHTIEVADKAINFGSRII